MEGVATKSLYRTTLKLQPYTDLLFLREKEKFTINHPEILNNLASIDNKSFPNWIHQRKREMIYADKC